MDYIEIEKISVQVKAERAFVDAVFSEISKNVIGQKKLIERMMSALFCGGHVLVEGLPGLAKTLAVRSFAASISSSFSRVQFTPDLLPADLTGTQIFNPKNMEFFTRKGPLFTNILLADEINRAPAKVQSALLQAMEERMITIGETTYKLDDPFMVLATENPIEQEGTYPLPEAQLDRFMMKVLVEYPSKDEEAEILKKIYDIDPKKINPVMTAEKLFEIRKIIESIYVDDKILSYIVSLIDFTRRPNDKMKKYIEFGASPRASIALMKLSKCAAFFAGRGFVTPDDVKEIAYDVLRHRIILSYDAEAEEIKTDTVIKLILDQVEVP
ncbi:MAG TPA: MoxR family ATPase [Spirochaetota bacterium]|nr:MoxR family ATPase [Spirochaetota bacterium]HPW51716.1 MoxR family ATPase [Spirochaetota bacterium]